MPNIFAETLGPLRVLLPARLRTDIPVVPVVRLSGVIGVATPLRPGLLLSTAAKTLERAFSVSNARAVAMIINSPGGSPSQSHLIYRRIRDLSAEKKIPVIAFVEDIGASGGYMLACAADEIICDQFSIVGSIGVVGGSFGFAKLMDKLGVERRLYNSGELKGPEKTLFSGEFWTAPKAIELGLADSIGDLRSVLRARYGEKLRTPLISAERSFFGRKLQGVGLAGAFAGEPALADDLVSALETRALWARY